MAVNGPQEPQFFEEEVSADGGVQLLVCTDGEPVRTVELDDTDDRSATASTNSGSTGSRPASSSATTSHRPA
ncbi:MAG: hypothetical protein ACI9CA_000218 [Natronomonas sp.]